jgi:PAS domain S-box-containing protein
LEAENARLRQELQEAWEIIDAIRPDRVDGVVVGKASGKQVCLIVDAARRAEQAFRESEERLRAIYDNAAIGIKELTLDGRILQVNPKLCQTLGYTAVELVQLSAQQIVHPEDWQNEQALLARLRSGEIESYVLEKRYLRKDGVPVWVRVTSSLTRGPHEPHRISVVEDITDRKRTEEALRETEDQFHLLADSIPQLAWIAQPDGHIIWYNKRWYEYTGTTFEEMAGWGWQAVHDPAELPRVLASWKASLAKGEPWDETFPLRRHDGAMRWHLSRAMPLRDHRNRVVRWFGTNTDITDRREMEEALKDADRRKDEFLAMLGHELRNPLAGIVNGVQVLKMVGGGTQDVQAMREVIERQAHHMTRLIEDLLDVSRISRGKIQLRKERVDLVELVRTTVEGHRLQLEAGRLALSLQLPARPFFVYADPTRLAQVVGNLLHNAQKFTDPGGQVAVAVAEESLGRFAVLSVRDTGIGLEPAALTRVFEAFHQANASLDRNRGGLGLGLALVKGLVEMHGGEVTACSQGLGHGTEFRVRLPASQEGAAAERIAEKAPKPSLRYRVLLIDDRRDARVPLEKMLRLLGQDVNAADSGRTGLEAAAEFLPEIVLCDVGLPDMSGYELARTLRTLPGVAAAYIVAVTGYGQEEDRRRAIEAGCDYHVTKPVSKDQLERLLSQQPRFGEEAG